MVEGAVGPCWGCGGGLKGPKRPNGLKKAQKQPILVSTQGHRVLQGSRWGVLGKKCHINTLNSHRSGQAGHMRGQLPRNGAKGIVWPLVWEMAQKQPILANTQSPTRPHGSKWGVLVKETHKVTQ